MTEHNSQVTPLQHEAPVAPAPEQGVAPSTEVKSAAPAIPALLARTETAAICIGAGLSPIPPVDALKDALIETGNFYGFNVPAGGSVGFMFGETTAFNTLAGMWREEIAAERTFVLPPPTTTPPNFLQEEGFALIRAEQKRSLDTLVLIMPPLMPKVSFAHRSLPALLEALQARATNVVVIFQSLDPGSAAHVPHYFDATLVVTRCEPDHGYTSACIVQPAAGTYLSAVAGLPVIENIRPGARGQLDRKSYTCWSPDPLTREIARLINEGGATYQSIGDKLGLNKSTVKRRVDALPFNPKRSRVSDDQDLEKLQKLL